MPPSGDPLFSSSPETRSAWRRDVAVEAARPWLHSSSAPSRSLDMSEAFERNRGLISPKEQEKLAGSLAVVAGCGGVGGLHAHTLARLGVGRFRLTDPDAFDVPNFNRQIGATVDTVGRNKAAVTAEMIRSIRPDASVEVVEGGVTRDNAAAFVDGADVVIDGIDFFSLEARRILFREARAAGVPALTAGPLGFSGTLHVFGGEGRGMSFDEYFDLRDGQDPFDQLVLFIVGLAPAPLHLAYLDLTTVDPSTGRGPSSIVGTQLAACLVGAQAVRVLLGRADVPYAPRYFQFDAYRLALRRGILRGGNRNLLQRWKRRIVGRRLAKMGWAAGLERRRGEAAAAAGSGCGWSASGERR